MLEAMEERQVTIGETTYALPSPFFVLATQNPVEQEGTYNLPEAELDRFLMKIVINYPEAESEKQIVKTCGKAPLIPVNKLLSAEDITALKNLSEKVSCDDKLVDYIVSILSVTRPSHQTKNSGGLAGSVHDITRYITFGASPRAGIALVQCAKVSAMLAGRDYVLPEDIKANALNVLRHRLVLSYEASADNVTADEIISRILEVIPLP